VRACGVGLTVVNMIATPRLDEAKTAAMVIEWPA
jgi:hypothetical protein